MKKSSNLGVLLNNKLQKRLNFFSSSSFQGQNIVGRTFWYLWILPWNWWLLAPITKEFQLDSEILHDDTQQVQAQDNLYIYRNVYFKKHDQSQPWNKGKKKKHEHHHLVFLLVLFWHQPVYYRPRIYELTNFQTIAIDTESVINFLATFEKLKHFINKIHPRKNPSVVKYLKSTCLVNIRMHI